MTKAVIDKPKDLYLYVLVRTDMPSLGKGKACAHSAHAGNQFTFEHYVEPLEAAVDVDVDVKAWHRQARGFGTTIALDVPYFDTFKGVVVAAQKMGFKANTVLDPTYPYEVDCEIADLIDPARHTMPPVFGRKGFKVCFREEYTTAYIFGEKSELSILLRQFNLLPND